MGVMADRGLKYAALSKPQLKWLTAREHVLQLAADLAHAQVTLYVRAKTDGCLALLGQARPNTSFVQYNKALQPAALVSATEEPLIWRSFCTGERICGYREWALGMLLTLNTFALRDPEGEVVGILGFESTFEDTTELLIETAQMLFVGPPLDDPGDFYRPLSPQDGILISGDSGRIIFANGAAESIYKILGVGKVIGRLISDRQLSARLAAKAANLRQPQIGELELGNLVLAQRALPVIKDGQTCRTVLIVTNVTEVRKKEKELQIKSAVIQEIHHRVKNNLQTIASLLRLQARRSRSPEVKAALRESVNRILSISVVHEFLSQQDAEIIDVAEVAKNIMTVVVENMLDPDFAITTRFNSQHIVLPSDQAINLALAINELIQNAIEHGFAGRRQGTLSIDMAMSKTDYQIDIRDDGNGLPPDFDLQTSGSLGLQIIRTLIENDLGGRFQLCSENGTRAHITVPRNKVGG